MVLSLLTIEVNRGIEGPILRLDGAPDCERLPVRFGIKDYSVALLKDFRPEVVGKAQCGSKHTHDW
jgi:hypothetical protein